MSGHGYSTKLAAWEGGKKRMEWERRAGRLKLDEAKVRVLRKASRAEVAALAAEYGVSVGVALKVRRRVAWTWVTDE